jgi:hemerythrin-like domain-containing protein
MALRCGIRRRTVEHKAISEQVLVEHQILAHIASALRATLGWKHQGADLTRKIGSLRFVGQSLQRHLKHLMGLEEEDGYMSVILELHPELNDKVEALRQEHDQFRKGLNRILTRLRLVQPTDHLALAKISEDLLVLLKKLDEHSHKETGLIQRALLKDAGGEG